MIVRKSGLDGFNNPRKESRRKNPIKNKKNCNRYFERVNRFMMYSSFNTKTLLQLINFGIQFSH